MKTITNTFLKGLLFSLPIVITFGLIYWIFNTVEELLRVPLEWMLPDGWYRTGMALVATIAIIFLLGLLVQAYIINRFFLWIESLLTHIPFVKTLYLATKDMLSFFAAGKDGSMQRVVRVTFDNNVHLIGFVTQESVDLGNEHDLLAVYMPMSYMIGGYLIYVPRNRIEPLDIPVQQAMQQILTAHIAGKNHY